MPETLKYSGALVFLLPNFRAIYAAITPVAQQAKPSTDEIRLNECKVLQNLQNIFAPLVFLSAMGLYISRRLLLTSINILILCVRGVYNL